MARHEKHDRNIQKIWIDVEDFYKGIQKGINVNNAQPGCGKTYGFTRYIQKYPNKRIAYFSSNHDQLSRVEKELNTLHISSVHWKGFTRLCLRYPKSSNPSKWTTDEKFVYNLYRSIPAAARFICVDCNNDKCQYQKQFGKRDKVVLSPLEFLFRSDIVDRFDNIWIDESVKKINCYNWDFSVSRFVSFEKALEDISKKPISKLRKYYRLFYKLHTELLVQTSIIFTRPEEELLNFNRESYSGEEWVNKGFLQNENIVTHYTELDLSKILRIDRLKENEKYYLLSPQPRYLIKKKIEKYVREAIKEKKIENIINSYIDLDNFFNFFDILIYNDACKGGCIVSERIEIVDNPSYIKLKDIIYNNDKYERGFIEDKPYFLDKKTGRYIISNIGKEYTAEDKILESKNDSWLTVGLPFMITVFKIAESKPIVLMDATFNKIIYDQHMYRYLNSKNIKEEDDVPQERFLNPPKIQNKNSILFKIIPAKGKDADYPMDSLKNGGFENIYNQLKPIRPELKNKGKIGAILHRKFEADFKLSEIKNHFFNQRGTNKFIEVMVLIVIGTPYVPPYQTLFSYVLNFGQIPKNTTIKKDTRFQGYNDELLQQLLKVEVYDELYQGIHRCRPLLRDKIIICYCKLPEEIEFELTCKKLIFNEFCAELQGKKEYYQEYPSELIKLITNPNDKITINIINKICSSDPKKNYYTPLVLRLHRLLGLPPEFDLESGEEILNNALSPIKIKIINLLKRAKYERMGVTKLHHGTKSPRAAVSLCLWLLEKEKLVEIKVAGNKKVVILKKE